MRKIVIGLAAAAALVACGGPDHGTITDLTYDPDASFYMPQTVCSGSGASQTCMTTLTYYPIPECWHVWFELDGDKNDDCVTEADWHSLKIGQYFDERR
jgi:hypothetical protein